MYPELKDDEIIKKVGGRFHLAALIQKRAAALLTNIKPHVKVDKEKEKDVIAIAIREIMEGKIVLEEPHTAEGPGQVRETPADELNL